MPDTTALIATLRRPRILIRAARHGLQEYRRERDLRRLIGAQDCPPPASAVEELLVEEERLEQTRRDGGYYPIARHVEVLIALMAEARLMA
jgi:hypothetical protein